MNVGDRIRIERDEIAYPSKGTWPEFRGKTGTVVEINHDRMRPHLTEYAVVFGKPPRTFGAGGYRPTWFKAREISILASVGPLGSHPTLPPMNHTQETAA